MCGRLEGKIAVIIGGTCGIGEASAELFAAEGANVIIAGRSEGKGQRNVDRLGVNVFYKRTDVTKEDDIKAMIDSNRHYRNIRTGGMHYYSHCHPAVGLYH